MGQVFDKLQGKYWRRKKVRKIIDKVFDRVRNQSETVNLTFEDLYIVVLLVYNDINKHLPGPHFDPPSKEEECDINLDGEIDREDFSMFIQWLMGDTFIIISQGLILILVVAPIVAMATKRATEGVPSIGKVVQKLPNSIYASLVTLVLVLFQKSVQESD
ncbi:hypothetical protein UlMin_004919 [Ulmus minor]